MLAQEHAKVERGDARSTEELALLARAGSTTAFEAVVVRFEKPVYNFLLLRTGNAQDAEELTQETFLRAWQKLEHYQARWKFSTWLFTLARRLAASRGRSLRRELELDATHDPSSQEPDPARELCAREQRDRLWSIAARVLTAEQRSALLLRYVEGLSIEEIATVLGRMRTSVRVLLFRSREKLARHLDARQHDDMPWSPRFPRQVTEGER
jgi:RNA polymerase sigma-70 factor (ECF subfamily)